MASLFSCPLLGRGGLTPLDHFTAPGGDSVKGRRPFMLTPSGGRDKWSDDLDAVNDRCYPRSALTIPSCSPWNKCRKSLERVSEIIGTGVGNHWNRCRKSLEWVSKIIGTSVGNHWNRCRKSLEQVSEIFGMSVENHWDGCRFRRIIQQHLYPPFFIFL